MLCSHCGTDIQEGCSSCPGCGRPVSSLQNGYDQRQKQLSPASDTAVREEEVSARSIGRIDGSSAAPAGEKKGKPGRLNSLQILLLCIFLMSFAALALLLLSGRGRENGGSQSRSTMAPGNDSTIPQTSVQPSEDHHAVMYAKAVSLMQDGRYPEAKELFLELGDYSDAAEMAKECDYLQAMQFLDQGAMLDAQSLFRELGDYKDALFYADVGVSMVEALGMMGQFDGDALSSRLYSIAEYFYSSDGWINPYGEVDDAFIDSDENSISIRFRGKEFYFVEEDPPSYTCDYGLLITDAEKPDTEMRFAAWYTYHGAALDHWSFWTLEPYREYASSPED